jgi:hypothetical protein
MTNVKQNGKSVKARHLRKLYRIKNEINYLFNVPRASVNGEYVVVRNVPKALLCSQICDDIYYELGYKINVIKEDKHCLIELRA